MKILGINTAQVESQIFLINDDSFVSFSFDSASKVSEQLLLEIEKILTSNHLKISDVDYIACCVGPGSFTGIRVGLAIAKAFMFANPKLKAISYGTFEPYLFQTNNNLTLYSQCTKNSFYKCSYFNDKILPIEIVGNLDDSGNNIYIIDKNIGYNSERNVKYLKFNEVNIKNFLLNKIENFEFVSVQNLKPDYICESQAERNSKK